MAKNTMAKNTMAKNTMAKNTMAKNTRAIGLVLVMLAPAAASCGDTQDIAVSTTTSPSGPAAAGSVETLAGTTWVAVSVAGEAVLADTPLPTLSFSTDGHVTGSAGCNDFAGDYTVDGTAITLTVGPTSRRPCGEQQGEQETRFLEALVQTARFTISDDALILSSVDGARLTSFDAA